MLFTWWALAPAIVFYLTQEAQSALEHADAICGYKLYIDLIEPEFPCEEYYATGMTQEIDRCRWALEKARTGKRVALLQRRRGCLRHGQPAAGTGRGLPGCCRGGGAWAHCRPQRRGGAGRTAGPRFLRDLAFRPAHPVGGHRKRLACAAQGDFCVALYNPSSKGRPDYLQRRCASCAQTARGRRRSAALCATLAARARAPGC